MSAIRSRADPRVRRWRALARDAKARRAEQCAWIEGPHLVEEYVRRCGPPRAIVVSARAMGDAEVAAVVARARLAPVVLAEALFAHVAEARTPIGVGAEIAVPGPDAANRDPHEDWVAIDGVQDPGNLGAILRAACAFGIQHALLTPDCADPWSPRALRAGAGAQFALDMAESRDLPGALRGHAGRIICTVPRAGTPLAQLDLRGPLAWIVGGEGAGVRDTLLSCAQARASIPLAGGIESLNVAAAAAICFFEAARQRAFDAGGLNRRGGRS